jgi:hypothetical protein
VTRNDDDDDDDDDDNNNNNNNMAYMCRTKHIGGLLIVTLCNISFPFALFYSVRPLVTGKFSCLNGKYWFV